MSFFYGFSIKNFKIFQDKFQINTAPITLLTGANNSGKSTINQAVKLLKNYYQGDIGNVDYKHDKTSIDFQKLVNEMPFTILDKKIGSLQNLKNVKSKNNIIEFSLPSNLEYYKHRTEMKITIEINENELLPAIPIKICLSDIDNQIDLFTIYKSEKQEFNCKINYLQFYKTYKNDCENYLILNQMLDTYKYNKEKLSDSENKTAEEEFNKFCFEIFGDIDLSIQSTESHRDEFGKINWLFISKENNPDFTHFFEKQDGIQKKFKELHVCSARDYSADSIINLDYLDDLNRFDFIHEVGSHYKSSTNSQSTSEKFVLQILDELSQEEFEVSKSYGLSSSVNDEIKRPSAKIVRILNKYKIDTYLSAEKSINFLTPENSFDSLKAINFYNFRDSLISDRGLDFFQIYIHEEITKAIKSCLSFNSIYFNNSYGIFNKTRIVDLSQSGDEEKDILDFLKNEYFRNPKSNVNKFFTKWLREFGIGDDINFSKIELFAQIKTERNGFLFNLSDEGFGVSKLFQLIIQILNTSNNSYVDVVNNYNPSVLLLEEPESGLHPALQSKLAEFFFEAYQLFNIQFIIETHSEYLIRKLQTMTADTNCKLTPKHTQMYYFYHPDSVPEGEQQVYPINIEEDGSMTRPFGKGFYDESTSLNIALYNYSKVNKN